MSKTTWEASSIDIGPDDALDTWCLVVLASRDHPERIGEIAFVDEPGWIGRQGAIGWGRRVDGAWQETGPARDPAVSRQHIHLTRDGRRWVATCAGRVKMAINGRPVEKAPLADGDVVALGRRVAWLWCRRARQLPVVRYPTRFGAADQLGIVGESDITWRLRARLEAVANRSRHVLITGPTGAGKELAARAIHALSPRSTGPFVARSAATLPDTLVDAELFGNVAGYPQAGMPERPGLVGAAHGGTLFLDEVAVLPAASQAKLLRVLDDGEYTRLGEAHPRASSFVCVAAMRQEESSLQEDLAARWPIRVEVEGLGSRPEDVPLIARALLERMRAEEPRVEARVFPEGRFDLPADVAAWLVRRAWPRNVRELESVLWDRIDGAEAGPLRPGPWKAAARDPNTLTRAEVQAALEAAGGVREQAWRALGLSSRHALGRLMRRFDL